MKQNQVQKARAAFSSGMVTLERERAEVRAERKRVTRVNDTLNATIVEQNERLETLASNCAHYRGRIGELQNRLSDEQDRNAKAYDELRSLKLELRQERNERGGVLAERDNALERVRSVKLVGFFLAALALSQALPKAWAQIQPIIQQVM